jgi:hypothetical protein
LECRLVCYTASRILCLTFTSPLMKDGLPAYPRGAGGSVSNGMRKWSKPTLRSFWQLLADFVAKVVDGPED